jgi:hypothetical protein
VVPAAVHVGAGTGIHQHPVNGGTVDGQVEVGGDDVRKVVRVVVHAMQWLGCTDH